MLRVHPAHQCLIHAASTAGISSVIIEWDETLREAEYQSGVNDLRSAIERADLPDGADDPLLRELSVSEVFASVLLAVADVGGVGEKSLREATREVKDRLEDLHARANSSRTGLKLLR